MIEMIDELMHFLNIEAYPFEILVFLDLAPYNNILSKLHRYSYFLICFLWMYENKIPDCSF